MTKPKTGTFDELLAELNKDWRFRFWSYLYGFYYALRYRFPVRLRRWIKRVRRAGKR